MTHVERDRFVRGDRRRWMAIAIVAAFVIAMRLLVPDPALRGPVSYACIIALGYGHLLGALVFARRHRRGRGVRVSLLYASGIGTLFATYSALLSLWPTAWVVPLLLSVWHTSENELCLQHAGRDGLRLPPIPGHLRYHAAAIAGAALLVAIALAAARDASALGDVFVAVTLYHLVSWLLVCADRIQALRRIGARSEARNLLTRLVWLHLPSIALCAFLWSVSLPPLIAWRQFLFAPGIYLFWAVLHVIQTVKDRIPDQPSPSRQPAIAIT